MSSVYEIFAQAQQRASQSLVGRLRRFESTQTFAADLENCVFRVLNIRKQEGVGDRLVRFLVSYLQKSPDYVTGILSAILPFLTAKDRNIRFRATQIIAQSINSLESIDDELYHDIRQALMKRIRDKVPVVRIQAVIGLGRLAENEMDDNPEKGSDSDSDEEIASQNLLEKLLDILQNDSNAEVRRVLLQNLPLTPTTLPFVLERARDRDALTRRAVYTKLLPTLGDFRHLSLSMREKLLRWGLRDRDESVRKATGRLFRERWVEDCAATHSDNSEQPRDKKTLLPPSLPALLELLERIDVVNSGGELGIALEAMKDFWAGRPDYADAIEFTDEFWLELTPESAFLARTLNDFCMENPEYEAMCEEKMPEVTRLGFYLQKYTNALLETIRSSIQFGGGEEETVEQEFIVEQLLHIAQNLDYRDEVGRQKMFSLLRNTLCMPDLPEECTRLTIEVLRLVCGSNEAAEREFCAVVMEAVSEVHDTITTDSNPTADAGADDDSFVSAKSEVSSKSTSTAKASSNEDDENKALREIAINMKCLHIAQCMLQNVDCVAGLQSNHHLVATLDNLIIPAVRSHESPIRALGILCLGLYCLLDRKLAADNIPLFRHCFAKSKDHANLQVTALQVLCDVVVKHGLAVDLEPFVASLDGEKEVQRCGVTSLGKLMLGRLYRDKKGEEGDADGEEGGEMGKRLEAAVDVAVVDEVPGVDMLVKVREAVGKALEERKRVREVEVVS